VKLHTIDFRHAPTQQWTAICRPDDPHKTLVRQDGALLYGFARTHTAPWHWTDTFGRIISFELDSERPCVSSVQCTESAAFPCVITRREFLQAWLTLRTFATLDDKGRRADVVLWEIEVKPGVREFKAALRIHADALDRCVATPRDGSRLVLISKKRAGKISDEDVAGAETMAYHFPSRFFGATARDFVQSFGFITAPQLLNSGEKTGGALVFPLDGSEEFSLEWAHAALDRERAFWTEWEKCHMAIKLPDEAMQAMVTASVRNIFQAREIKNGLPEFQVGATCYRGLWVVDGHFILEAIHFLNRGDEAEAGWEALLRRVCPSGAITEMASHLKETGISIATFVRQTELSGDWDRLRRTWPTVRKALDYIRSLRDQVANLPETAAEYRLLPKCFGDGGIAGDRAELTTALWTLFGLNEGAKAAKALGLAEDHAAFRAEFESLLEDFSRVAKKFAGTLPDGTPYLPMCLPGGSEHHTHPEHIGEVPPWNRINAGTATWAWAQAIYPGEILPPTHELVRNFLRLLDSLDDEQDVPANTGWLPFQSVWTYAASFYAHVWLYAGRADKAVDYLYGFVNLASPTRVWREEQGLRSSDHGDICGDMPHNWASAELIRLVRNLLIFERGSDLELLHGLPREWWPEPDRPLVVSKSATRFGPVSIEFSRTDGEAVLDIALASDWSEKAREIRLLLPGEAKSAVVNGHRIDVPADRKLVLAASSQVQFTLNG
jgi:hypothetical protein